MIDAQRLSNSYLFYRGRVALYAILKAMGVKDGDEVAIQAYTCLAVPEAVLATGAIPVYVDIEETGYNMEPKVLEQAITRNTKAIVLQHTFGIPAKITRILTIANEHGIPVIEDCCHSMAGKASGKVLGSFGAATFYSFEWGKPLVAGLGGALIVNDSDLNDKIKSEYKSFVFPDFSTTFKIELQYQAFNFLYRPELYWPVKKAFHLLSRLGAIVGNFSNLDCAGLKRSPEFRQKMILSAQRRLMSQLQSLEEVTKHSQAVTDFYKKEIRGPGIIHPELLEDSKAVFARYPLRVKNKVELLERAKEQNIELAEWYSTPVHPVSIDQSQLIGYAANSCPNAELRCLETVSLPTGLRVNKKFLQMVRDFFSC